MKFADYFYHSLFGYPKPKEPIVPPGEQYRFSGGYLKHRVDEQQKAAQDQYDAHVAKISAERRGGVGG